jgi:hypothetical protein
MGVYMTTENDRADELDDVWRKLNLARNSLRFIEAKLAAVAPEHVHPDKEGYVQSAFEKATDTLRMLS